MNLWSLLRVKPVHDGKFIGALRDPQIYTALWGPGLAHGEVSSRRLRYFPKSTNGRFYAT